MKPATHQSLLQSCRHNETRMCDLLRRVVEMESPSDNKEAIDKLGRVLAAEFQEAGGKTHSHRMADSGDHLQAEFAGQRQSDDKNKPLLLLGHFDTVWGLGTLSRMPFRFEDGRIFGPGVLDMKAGIVMMLFALRALRETNTPHRPVTVLLDTDEEVGSTSARPIIETAAKKCEAVLVLEPAQGSLGCLKTSRKGVGNYLIQVQGKAAHAGVDFEKGHNAILELSRQMLEISKFVDLSKGMTVNPGVISGGTRSNVVAAEAWAEVDVRITQGADARLLEERFASLKSFDLHCRVEVSGGLNRPPMERTEGTVRLFKAAQSLAQELGFELDESATGGGSDGNFTSALGIPTLDGLGAVGEGAHAAHEHIVQEELVRRTALLASLIAAV